MSKDYARIDRLYHVMVELLNAPKVKDQLMKMPSEVKKGEVLDFNGRSFGATDKPDGLIFPKTERVLNCQAVTSALKRDYTKALKEWLDGEAEATDETGENNVEEPTKKSKKKKTSETDDDRPEPTEEFNIVAEVKELLSNGKMKKAKKLVELHEGMGTPKCKKAKKLIEKAKGE